MTRASAAGPSADESICQGAAARRRRRWPWVCIALLIVLAAGSQLYPRLVVANTTQSVDPGLYLAWGHGVAVGKLVGFRVPEAARPYFAGRAGKPVEDAADWFLVKPVIAGPGDEVDATGRRVLVNGIDCGPIYERDDAGRALPHWRERRTLRDGEWFVVSRRAPGSLDGRYFGPVRAEQIECVRRPLLRWRPWRLFGNYEDRPPPTPDPSRSQNP